MRAIQVPRGALISTQISIMIFFLSVELFVSGRNSTNAKGFLKNSSEMSRKLPARLLLVLKSLLGVIGGPGCVFHGALHVRINSEGFAGFVRSAVGRGTLHLFTISPWFSTRTAMSMNISCSSLIDCSSLMNISCLENRFWGNYR